MSVNNNPKRKYIATCRKAGEFNNFAPGVEAITHYDVFLEDGKLFTESHPGGRIERYCCNPPAGMSEEAIIACVIEQRKMDKRWTVTAYN